MPKVSSKAELGIEIPETPEVLKATVMGHPLEICISKVSDGELKKVGMAYTEYLLKRADEIRTQGKEGSTPDLNPVIKKEQEKAPPKPTTTGRKGVDDKVKK